MIALIAGTGDLPEHILKALIAAGKRPLVCAMDGFKPKTTPDITFRIEHLGSFLASLREQGVQQVCMAGAVRRPEIDLTEIDELTLPLVPRIHAALALGDDGTLREIISIIEEFGLKVVGATELVPKLLPEVGVLSRARPYDGIDGDIRVASQTLLRMGAADSGQACVIKEGRVLAEEGPDGTDAMIRRFIPTQSDISGFGPLGILDDLVSSSADWLTGVAGTGKSAILFKAPKPNQDRRADLPVIGLGTVKNAVEAEFAGIVVQHNGVIILNLDEVISELDAHNMFLWVKA